MSSTGSSLLAHLLRADSSWTERAAILEEITQVQPEVARSFLPTVLESFEHHNAVIRDNAFRAALALVDKYPEIASPVLRAYRDALSSEDLSISNHALRMFSSFAKHLRRNGAFAFVQLALESCRRSNMDGSYYAVGDALRCLMHP